MKLYTLKSTDSNHKLAGKVLRADCTKDLEELSLYDVETGHALVAPMSVAYFEIETDGTLAVYMVDGTTCRFTPIDHLIPNITGHQTPDLMLIASISEEDVSARTKKTLLVFNREVNYPEFKEWCIKRNMPIMHLHETNDDQPYITLVKKASNTYQYTLHDANEDEIW